MRADDDAPALAGDRGGDGPTSYRQSSTRRPPLRRVPRGLPFGGQPVALLPDRCLFLLLAFLTPGPFRRAVTAEAKLRAGSDCSGPRLTEARRRLFGGAA